jgi:hypothetical protein
MASTWRLRQQHAMKTSIPVNCPWGSALSCCMAPVSLLATRCQPSVEPPCTCSSSSPTWAPSNRTDQRAVKRSAIAVNRRGAQHVPVVRPPFTFGCILRPGFVFSPRARARPKAAVVDDEGVVFLAMRPVFAISPPTSRLMCQVPPPPHFVMFRTQAVGMKSLQSVEQPAELAPVRFNC